MARYLLGEVAPAKQALPLKDASVWLLNLDMVESNTGRIIEYLFVDQAKVGGSTITFDTKNVLYSKLRPYLNKVVVPNRPGFATSEFIPLCPDPNILNRDYLAYFLRSKHFVEYINDKTSGAKMPRANLSDFKAFPIDCPVMSEQERIVALLQSVSTLLETRRQQLLQLDELIKARFVEMFGTYPANQHGWETGTIREAVTEVRYGSSRKAAEGNTGKYPYLRMNNITYGGELDLSDTKTIDIPDDELPKCSVRRGDVLFNRTNSRELVGKTCVYNRDELMVLAGFVVRVRVNKKILPEFLSAFMNTDFTKAMLFAMCKAAIGQANINAQEFQNIGIYFPPVELQRQFVAFKEQVDKSKVVGLNHPLAIAA